LASNHGTQTLSYFVSNLTQMVTERFYDQYCSKKIVVKTRWGTINDRKACQIDAKKDVVCLVGFKGNRPLGKTIDSDLYC